MGISYTKQYIDDFLENHTEAHSMLCLSDLFDSFEVATIASEFNDKAELTIYPGAHISQLVANDKSYFVVVEIIKGNTITYYKEGKKITESVDDYFRKWKGFALFFTKKPESAEPDYIKNVKKENLKKFKVLLFTLSASILFSAILYASWPLILPVVFTSLIVIKLTGMGVSILLLSYTYNSKNSLLKGICNIGKKTNCGNILNSKAAKVFSFLSWSEVGLFYFASTFLALLITEIQQQIQGYYFLVVLNLLALPYTMYSLYYQKKIAKSWCVLCLCTQALLLSEFVVGLSLYSIFSIQNFRLPFMGILISGVFVISIWYLIKPLLEAKTELKIAKKDLRNFRQNLPLFQQALRNQPNLPYPTQADVLRFGTSNPKVHFTIFTSPVCTHCSIAHLIINKLFITYPNEIAYTEIFAISNDDRDERKQIAAHMLQLYKKCDREYTCHALHEWHADENRIMEKWMGNHPVTGNALTENNEIIGLHATIAQSLAITHTPTIVMNGKLLPDLYRVEDLEKIIPAFLKALEQSN